MFSKLYSSKLYSKIITALKNVGLKKKKANLKLKEMLKIAHSLTTVVETRDPSTFEHGKRVQEYSLLIAQKLNVPQEMIKVASVLHDIGKIGIPESILLKKDRLTHEEWEIIKQHPEIGQELLKKQLLDFPEEVFDAIKHHHETLDGEGYPDSLEAEKLPLAIRILSVADAFEAMTSERIYRKIISQEEALAELERCKGKKYDPLVVEALISIIKEKNNNP
ncbi:HD domain-containing protein [bacterium]|nr:HD domain-containing protein [bacterium]